jgi:hypothetical protein
VLVGADTTVSPPAAAAVTCLLLLLKVVSSLRALEDFGFLVSMLLSTAAAMLPFGVMLALMVGGFSLIFALLGTGVDNFSGDESQIYLRLWDMYRLGAMGDFASDDYDSGSAIAFFIVLTVAVNVVMLNVLITIVGESYGQAQASRAELSRRTLAGTIVDIETAYLAPWGSRRVTRRGRPCGLLTHPKWLAAFMRMRVEPALHGHEKWDSSRVGQDQLFESTEQLEIQLQPAGSDQAIDDNEQQTERAMLRARTDQLTATQGDMLRAISDLASQVGVIHNILAPEEGQIDDETGRANQNGWADV